MQEARDQFENYEYLMTYMNSRPDWNVNIRFGTLGEYFEAVANATQPPAGAASRFPTFSGDFFTYADRADHYWSGYFTSRVFYKRLERILEYYLRTAEITYSLSNLIQKSYTNKYVNGKVLYEKLTTARRNLALFQHHDGITGTSKTPVVLDYADK
jgi:alpha-mannosidase II